MGYQQLLTASCQDSQLALEKASRFLLERTQSGISSHLTRSLDLTFSHGGGGSEIPSSHMAKSKNAMWPTRESRSGAPRNQAAFRQSVAAINNQAFAPSNENAARTQLPSQHVFSPESLHGTAKWGVFPPLLLLLSVQRHSERLLEFCARFDFEKLQP